MGFMAPELLLTGASYASDIYSYVMTTVQIITGEHPKQGMAEQQVQEALASFELDPLQAKAALSRILIRCCCYDSKSVELRPSAKVVKEEMTAILCQAGGDIRGGYDMFQLEVKVMEQRHLITTSTSAKLVSSVTAPLAGSPSPSKPTDDVITAPTENGGGWFDSLKSWFQADEATATQRSVEEEYYQQQLAITKKQLLEKREEEALVAAAELKALQDAAAQKEREDELNVVATAATISTENAIVAAVGDNELDDDLFVETAPPLQWKKPEATVVKEVRARVRSNSGTLPQAPEGQHSEAASGEQLISGAESISDLVSTLNLEKIALGGSARILELLDKANALASVTTINDVFIFRLSGYPEPWVRPLYIYFYGPSNLLFTPASHSLANCQS